jgi:hypothetical protein
VGELGCSFRSTYEGGRVKVRWQWPGTRQAPMYLWTARRIGIYHIHHDYERQGARLGWDRRRMMSQEVIDWNVKWNKDGRVLTGCVG